MQDIYGYRFWASFLAAKMHIMCRKQRIENPPVLNDWCNLEKSSYELPGIRKMWLRIMNHERRRILFDSKQHLPIKIGLANDVTRNWR